MERNALALIIGELAMRQLESPALTVEELEHSLRTERPDMAEPVRNGKSYYIPKRGKSFDCKRAKVKAARKQNRRKK